jgi:hypothetical protein
LLAEEPGTIVPQSIVDNVCVHPASEKAPTFTVVSVPVFEKVLFVCKAAKTAVNITTAVTATVMPAIVDFCIAMSFFHRT